MIKSAGRVIRLLELFAAGQQPARMTEIARALALPESSTSILLRSLVKQGYLTFDTDNRSYMPAMRVAMLGSWFQHNLLSGTGMVTCLEDLNQSLRECIVLGMRNGLQVQFVHVIQSLEPIRYYIKPGSSRPLLESALGKMILSRMTDDEIIRLVWRHNSERSESAPALETKLLLRDVALARQQSYFETRELVSAGIGMIAVLIPFSIAGRAVSLAVGAPTSRLDANRGVIIANMSEAIRTLSAQESIATTSAAASAARHAHAGAAPDSPATQHATLPKSASRIRRNGGRSRRANQGIDQTTSRLGR